MWGKVRGWGPHQTPSQNPVVDLVPFLFLFCFSLVSPPPPIPPPMGRGPASAVATAAATVAVAAVAVLQGGRAEGLHVDLALLHPRPCQPIRPPSCRRAWCGSTLPHKLRGNTYIICISDPAINDRTPEGVVAFFSVPRGDRIIHGTHHTMGSSRVQKYMFASFTGLVTVGGLSSDHRVLGGGPSASSVCGQGPCDTPSFNIGNCRRMVLSTSPTELTKQ